MAWPNMNHCPLYYTVVAEVGTLISCGPSTTFGDMFPIQVRVASHSLRIAHFVSLRNKVRKTVIPLIDLQLLDLARTQWVVIVVVDAWLALETGRLTSRTFFLWAEEIKVRHKSMEVPQLPSGRDSSTPEFDPVSLYNDRSATNLAVIVWKPF